LCSLGAEYICILFAEHDVCLGCAVDTGLLSELRCRPEIKYLIEIDANICSFLPLLVMKRDQDHFSVKY
jgi:hypothetical protein